MDARRGRLLLTWLPLVCLSAFMALQLSIRRLREGHGIRWAANYTVGLKQSQQTRRPLLLVFHTPACVWCDRLDADTLTDPKVIALSRAYVCVRLESDTDGALVERYAVSDYPTTLVTDAQGKPRVRLTGYVPPSDFLAALHGEAPARSFP